MTIAGAWAGSAKLMRIYASGTNLGFPDVILEPLNLRPVLRTYESSAFLMPSKDFWSVEEVSESWYKSFKLWLAITDKIHLIVTLLLGITLLKSN